MGLSTGSKSSKERHTDTMMKNILH
jgi:hypothetical protein